jgi:hypothetical protein
VTQRRKQFGRIVYLLDSLTGSALGRFEKNWIRELVADVERGLSGNRTEGPGRRDPTLRCPLSHCLLVEHLLEDVTSG